MPYLRILLVAAIAFGAYTFGARAGRSRYRTIKKNAKKAWNSPGCAPHAAQPAQQVGEAAGSSLARSTSRQAQP